MNNIINRKKGFTLIELLVVVSIIGIFFIRLGKKQNIMAALYKGLIAAGVLAAIAFYPITK